jgi:hypothetical protein
MPDTLPGAFQMGFSDWCVCLFVALWDSYRCSDKNPTVVRIHLVIHLGVIFGVPVSLTTSTGCIFVCKFLQSGSSICISCPPKKLFRGDNLLDLLDRAFWPGPCSSRPVRPGSIPSYMSSIAEDERGTALLLYDTSCAPRPSKGAPNMDTDGAWIIGSVFRKLIERAERTG